MSTAARAAGILFVHDGQVLLLKRAASAKDHPSTWGLPGGHIEAGESPKDAARRETREEVGHGYLGPLRNLWVSDDGFACYGAVCEQRFAPRLNHEHDAARWAPFDKLPEPLHPSLKESLMSFFKQKPKQAQDTFEESKHPRATNGQFGAGSGDPAVVNVPLHKRGDIDAQIDKYKKQQAAEAKAMAAAKAATNKTDKARAKELFAEHGKAMLARYEAKFGRKQIADILDSMVKWEPAKFLAFTDKYLKETAPKQAADKLVAGKSDEARSENIATEIRAGKDPKQAAAIAYSVQRKAGGSDAATSFRQALDCLHQIADRHR